MFAHTRRAQLLDLLIRKKQLAVRELPARLKASPATVRRDLDQLERLGKLVRSHGSISHPDYAGGEQAFARKARAAVAEKQAIATYAAGLVPAGAVVFVDSGTTCLEIGRRLLAMELTLYTNSLPLLAEPTTGTARLVSLGGEVRQVSRAFVGGLTMEWLAHLRFDVAFVAASGLDPIEGASTTELTEAAIKRECAARSRRAILVADSTKWNKPVAVQFAPWKAFDDFVTDHKLSRAENGRLRRSHVTVHTVSVS